MAAGLMPPEPAPPATSEPQTLEERRDWFAMLPKPRQEVDCGCLKDGVPEEFCRDCLGTGKHARRNPDKLRGEAPPLDEKSAHPPKRATKAPEKKT